MLLESVADTLYVREVLFHIPANPVRGRRTMLCTRSSFRMLGTLHRLLPACMFLPSPAALVLLLCGSEPPRSRWPRLGLSRVALRFPRSVWDLCLTSFLSSPCFCLGCCAPAYTILPSIVLVFQCSLFSRRVTTMGANPYAMSPISRVLRQPMPSVVSRPTMSVATSGSEKIAILRVRTDLCRWACCKPLKSGALGVLEAAGVEPASENTSPRDSTCLSAPVVSPPV